jgi:hypothetical protein
MLQDVLSLVRGAGQKMLAIYDATQIGQQDGWAPLTAVDPASHHTMKELAGAA